MIMERKKTILILFYIREISDETSKMKNKERYMNNQFTTLCHEYKEVQ